MSRGEPPNRAGVGQETVFRLIQRHRPERYFYTRLIMVWGSDENNRSIPGYIEGASGPNLPKEHASDHKPKQHSSFVGQF